MGSLKIIDDRPKPTVEQEILSSLQTIHVSCLQANTSEHKMKGEIIKLGTRAIQAVAEGTSKKTIDGLMMDEFRKKFQEEKTKV